MDVPCSGMAFVACDRLMWYSHSGCSEWFHGLGQRIIKLLYRSCVVGCVAQAQFLNRHVILLTRRSGMIAN